MTKHRRYIIIDERDNVATTIEDIDDNEIVTTDRGDIRIVQHIPFGHKFALEDMEAGDYVIKYGERIGRVTATLTKGSHVHVHNVEDIVDEVRKN
ncbi:MAG: UxaA family hydrolase [Desulfobacteraceae bacterium]|nr:UxaA family hydrolase [Desulfobacteraceae bacterium]